MRSLFALNGPSRVSQDHFEFQKPFDLIVAVDGGAHHLERLGLSPNYIVGDFDSIAPELLDRLIQAGVRVHLLPCDKDYADFEIAANLVLADYSIQSVSLLGVSGGRTDHALLNMLAIPRLFSNFNSVTSIEDEGISMFIRSSGEYSFLNSHGQILSLIPISGTWVVRSVSGVKWKLENETLFIGTGRTLSNRIIDDTAVVAVELVASPSTNCIEQTQCEPLLLISHSRDSSSLQGADR